MKVYIVTEPESIRGIYETWPACEAAVSGIRGARYQSVPSKREAEALLRGDALTLPRGVYAFVDGNHLGGVGIVFVKQKSSGRPIVKEVSTTVSEVFSDKGLKMLESPEAITEALHRLRNVLAELAGLYKAIDHIAPRTEFTIVHDYEGIGAWITGSWKTRDPLVAEIVQACRQLLKGKFLTAHFQHQLGHQSTHVGHNDFAAYNALADTLATKACRSNPDRNTLSR